MHHVMSYTETKRPYITFTHSSVACNNSSRALALKLYVLPKVSQGKQTINKKLANVASESINKNTRQSLNVYQSNMSHWGTKEATGRGWEELFAQGVHCTYSSSWQDTHTGNAYIRSCAETWLIGLPWLALEPQNETPLIGIASSMHALL